MQKRMPTTKKIPKTVEILHAVIQGQVPNIVKTAGAVLMPRRCTTTRCAETVPNIQEIQKTDWRCSSAVQYENEVTCPL